MLKNVALVLAWIKMRIDTAAQDVSDDSRLVNGVLHQAWQCRERSLGPSPTLPDTISQNIDEAKYLNHQVCTSSCSELSSSQAGLAYTTP
jgi:hypothetical protein